MKKLILSLLIPFQKWIQRLGYIESNFTKEDINYLLAIIKVGDVLGSYESGRFTSWFIKGNYDHVAIVDDLLYVIESVGDKFINGKNVGGVRRVPLEEWLWKKNHIFVARQSNQTIAIAAGTVSKTHVGKGYDYVFSFGSKKLYCSELPYICYKPLIPDLFEGKSKRGQILPIDYMNSKHFNVIYDSRKDLKHDK